jgi:hypothetical protein
MEGLFFNVGLCFYLVWRFLCSFGVFKVDAGFLEGIVRGYKAGILTQAHYANLTQCETLEGASRSLCSMAS